MNAPMTRAEAVATGVAGTALPNIDQAVTFLTALDEDAATFCFQTFDDQKARKDASLTRVLNGTLEQHFAELADLNRRGAGIFVTVNVTDGKGRKLENMLRPRALFQEADRPNTPVPPLDPHIEVESSPDGTVPASSHCGLARASSRLPGRVGVTSPARSSYSG